MALQSVLRFLRSAGFRFALLFAAIYLLASLLLALVLWYATAASLERQTDAALRREAAGLIQRWRDGGPPAVAEAIAERLAADLDGATIYFLAGPGQERLAGNLQAWPNTVREGARRASLILLREEGAIEVRLHVIDLDPWHRLLLGRDISERALLREILAEGMAWSAVATIGFAFFGAALLRRAVEKRLRPAALTAQAIAAGDLSRRVPLSQRDDEFDRLGQSMNDMLERINRLMSGIREVSDAIAHDLRTPIARARAKLESALIGTTEAEALRRAIEQAIADLDHISRVFAALLRIAEAEAGARRSAFTPLDLVALLTELVEFYAPLVEAKNLTLETILPEKLPLVGDRDLLAQAIGNLLDNAVKFTPSNGCIRLSARALATEGAEIIIADSGPGLAPADRRRAGERFFRADAARATPGSGLGLSLVRAVAQLHGGELRLEDATPSQNPLGLQVILRLGSGER